MSFDLPPVLHAIPRNVYTALGLPLACGMASGLVTRSSVNTWYPSLRKPAGEPPRLAFPVAWTSLYLGMGLGSYVLQQYVDRAPAFTALHENAAFAVKLYWLQFGLNMAWTPLFFGARRTGLALVDILALTPAVYALTYYAYKVDPRTAWAFVPYSLWTSYATYLNAAIWWLNSGPGSKGIGKARKLN